MRSPARAALCVLALAACGDEGASTALEGIYAVGTWTENPTACDAEGPSVAPLNDPFVYVKLESFFGSEFLNVVNCDDEADCDARASDDDTIHLSGFAFDLGNDRDGWTSHSSAGFGDTPDCTGFVTDGRLTSAEPSIRIEKRRTDSAPFSDAECSDEAAEAAAAGQPCADLEVVVATFVRKY